jgi:8-oxo-dGTP pyrophosphatase MutT (NUDIX family)
MAGEVVVVYAQQEPPRWWDAAVFLAGPTPRDPAVASWRPAAVDLLTAQWRGPGRLVLFVPEARGGGLRGSWQDQVKWEDRYLNACDVIMFWVPRDMATLPGLTTNVEWGRWEASGKVVLGTPPAAPSTRYLRHYADQHRVPVADTLDATVDVALGAVGVGARREAGACEVPLLVWRTTAFQRWYDAQCAAGNLLTGARLLWTFRVGADLFYWALRVRVYVAAEDRVKDNEVVLSRPDVVTVALYRRGATVEETAVVLVREFRSPSSAADGYVRELPGGAVQAYGADPVRQAVAEVAEETGLVVDPQRLRAHGSRQVVATLSTHRAYLFSVELTAPELAWLSARPDAVHGVATDGELARVEVATYGQLLRGDRVDWATLGALSQALSGDCRPADSDQM